MKRAQLEIYTDTYKAGVQDLILGIQRNEFGIDIDLDRQPDLRDIPTFYQTNLGNFWIARIEEHVIGTIALLDIGHGQGALRKMFVDKEFRGKQHSIGQQLLDTLLSYAAEVNIREIYLGTTEKFVGAQRFYEKNHFIEIDKRQLPVNFPIMSVDIKFYKLNLAGSQNTFMPTNQVK